MELTIVGAGAIGGITGAHLARAGHRVLLADRDREHVEAIQREGLEVGGRADFRVRVASLKSTSGSPDRHAARVGIESLGGIPEGSAHREKAVALLIKLLDDRDSNVVSAAVHSLKNIGPDAKDALPKLKRLASRGSKAARARVNEAIDMIQGGK